MSLESDAVAALRQPIAVRVTDYGGVHRTHPPVLEGLTSVKLSANLGEVLLDKGDALCAGGSRDRATAPGTWDHFVCG